IRATEPRDSALVIRRLGDAPIIACASPGYLARCGRPAHPRELATRPCVVDSNFRGGARWRFRERAPTGLGAPFTVSVRGPVRVNSPVRVRELTARGLGVALIPEFVARDAIAAGRLVRVLEGYEGYGWAIYAVWPSARQLSGKVRAFVDVLAAALRSE
ncbi:MAG: substrate binding domain-containing protein, partial [Myxococcales bacterium]|nr:substrate binding domain-containing protein [Myxococcales bacterium]